MTTQPLTDNFRIFFIVFLMLSIVLITCWQFSIGRNGFQICNQTWLNFLLLHSVDLSILLKRTIFTQVSLITVLHQQGILTFIDNARPTSLYQYTKSALFWDVVRSATWPNSRQQKSCIIKHRFRDHFSLCFSSMCLVSYFPLLHFHYTFFCRTIVNTPFTMLFATFSFLTVISVDTNKNVFNILGEMIFPHLIVTCRTLPNRTHS